MVLGTALPAAPSALQTLLAPVAQEIADPSRNSVGAVLDQLVATGDPNLALFLEAWSGRTVWQNTQTGLFFIGANFGRNGFIPFIGIVEFWININNDATERIDAMTYNRTNTKFCAFIVHKVMMPVSSA